jgi:hypothetical protein
MIQKIESIFFTYLSNFFAILIVNFFSATGIYLIYSFIKTPYWIDFSFIQIWGILIIINCLTFFNLTKENGRTEGGEQEDIEEVED